MLTGVELAKPFVKATIDVLGTMAGITAKAGVPYMKKNATATGDVSAVIGVSGGASGSIAVSFTRPCAIALVKGMLGDAIENVLQDIQDAVGEVTNMISGQARAGLKTTGLTLQGTTPTVIVGDGHMIRHMTQSPVIAIPFSTPAGEFTVEFCFEQ